MWSCKRAWLGRPGVSSRGPHLASNVWIILRFSYTPCSSLIILFILLMYSLTVVGGRFLSSVWASGKYPGTGMSLHPRCLRHQGYMSWGPWAAECHISGESNPEYCYRRYPVQCIPRSCGWCAHPPYHSWDRSRQLSPHSYGADLYTLWMGNSCDSLWASHGDNWGVSSRT